MNKLEAMRVFAAVVDAGSLSGAGRRLGMPLATVSRKLSDLEAQLKVSLLIRTTRQLTLTDAGRQYHEACHRILADLEEADRVAAGEYTVPRGELVITAPIVFGRLHVLPVITDFLKACPEVDVRLMLSDQVSSLLDDHIDLAVRIQQLPDSGLMATRIGQVRRVVCASPAYLAEHGEPGLPQDLLLHPCISHQMPLMPTSWSFCVDGQDVALAIKPRLGVSTAEAAIDAAIAQSGITQVLCYQMAAAERAGLLRKVLTDYECPAVPVSLVYNRQGRLPLKLRAFLDHAVPRLRASLGGSLSMKMTLSKNGVTA